MRLAAGTGPNCGARFGELQWLRSEKLRLERELKRRQSRHKDVGEHIRQLQELYHLDGLQDELMPCMQGVLVRGEQLLCLLSHSASFAVEQPLSTAASMTRAVKGLGCMSLELAKPGRKFRKAALHKGIRCLLAPTECRGSCPGICRERTAAEGWTSRWTTPRCRSCSNSASGHSACDQPHRLDGGHWARRGPMHHWTDSKIRAHAFYCTLAAYLSQHVRCKA